MPMTNEKKMKHKTLEDSVLHTICNVEWPDSVLKYMGLTRTDIIALKKQQSAVAKKKK